MKKCRDCEHCQPLDDEEGICEFFHLTRVVKLEEFDENCPMMDENFRELMRVVEVEDE